MAMSINCSTVDDVAVVALDGQIDSVTAPTLQDELHPLVTPGGRMLVDMSDVDYMSSAGLRTMLLLYRESETTGCRLALVGVSEELQHMMSAVGFLEYFALNDTVAAGLRHLSVAEGA